MRLTDEQRVMVEENHNLIYWFINLKGLDIEEWYDLLAIELCYAVMKYNPERGSFSNYFTMRAEGLVGKEYRKSQAKKRIPKGVEFIDNIHYLGEDDDMLDKMELKAWIDGADCEILTLKAEGYSQMEIAHQLGVSQSYVSKVLKRLKEEYYGAYGQDD